MRIGFIGLGKMGEGMAANLLRAGHSVTVYNRTKEKTAALVKEGASAAATPADLAENAEAVLTMLSDDSALSETVFGEHGLISTLPKAAVHISCSTASVDFVRKLAEAHAQKGQGFVTAAVFGRPEAAASKQLIVAAAGDSEVVRKVAPLLDAIGRKTIVIGPEPWQANAVKLCGNFMIASMMEAFGEAFATLRKANIDPHHFLVTMGELFGSPIYKNYGIKIVDQNFDPAGFKLKLGLKDMRQVLEFAQEQETPMPLASLLRDHLLSAMANGQESLDWSSISKVSARAAGLN